MAQSSALISLLTRKRKKLIFDHSVRNSYPKFANTRRQSSCLTKKLRRQNRKRKSGAKWSMQWNSTPKQLRKPTSLGIFCPSSFFSCLLESSSLSDQPLPPILAQILQLNQNLLETSILSSIPSIHSSTILPFTYFLKIYVSFLYRHHTHLADKRETALSNSFTISWAFSQNVTNIVKQQDIFLNGFTSIPSPSYAYLFIVSERYLSHSVKCG